MTIQRTAVYRFFNAEGDLLYVGITIDLMARWRWHEKHADWWAEQARIEVVWHDNRADADAEETQAVRTEGTLRNVQKRGKTPIRSFRMCSDLWDEFGLVTAAMGVTRTDVLRQFMRWAAGEPDVQLPDRPTSEVLATVAKSNSTDGG